MNVNLRRESDHPVKFKKRFLLIPIGILVATVVGFSSLKTFEKQSSPATETKTTATVEFDKAPPVPNQNQNKSISPPSQAMVDAMNNKGAHLQISLDVLKERENFKAQQQRWLAQMILSGAMSLASLYVILSKRYPDEVNKFAYSTVAFIMGFWLKGL